jgi:hypothetical protein
LVVRFIAAHGGDKVKEPLDDILQTAPGEQRFGYRRGLGDGFSMRVIAGDIGPSHSDRFFDDIPRAEKIAMRIDRFLGHDVLLSRMIKNESIRKSREDSGSDTRGVARLRSGVYSEEGNSLLDTIEGTGRKIKRKH